MTSSVEHPVASGRPESIARLGVTGTDIMLLLMVLIWGVNFSIVKYGTTVIHPFAFNALRLALASVVLVVASSSARQAGPRARDLPALLALGVLGNGVYQLLFIAGIARTRAGNAALVLAATPALVALIGRVRGSERVGGRAWAGILLSMLGIALVVFSRPPADGRSSTLAGNLLILAGCVCWAVYTVLIEPYTQRLSPVTTSAVTMTAGTATVVAFSVSPLLAVEWTRLPLAAWGSILYSGIGALAIAYVIWYRGVKVLGPTRTSMYSNLQPLAALLFAWLALGERPTSFQALGAATVIAGVLMTRR
ncbi:MAG TPA: DMT family transporter [Gemmatimonadaceae bacterium]|nr:DMT family transporter [Gemmatimonadaceae bacterium]